MKEITIGTKNQIVIPKEIRDNIKTISPGKQVMIYTLDNETIVIKIKNKDWISSTYGTMRKPWGNIDPIKEVHKMRKEWI